MVVEVSKTSGTEVVKRLAFIASVNQFQKKHQLLICDTLNYTYRVYLQYYIQDMFPLVLFISVWQILHIC